MAWLRKKGISFLLCFITGMISGAILAVTTFNLLISYRLDQLYKNIASLENTIEEKDTQLKKLENTINTEELILKEIETILVYDEAADQDDIDSITLEKAINEKYSILLGKEVKYIDGDLVAGIVDQRILRTEDRKYQAKVQKIILTDVLKIWVLIIELDE